MDQAFETPLREEPAADVEQMLSRRAPCRSFAAVVCRRFRSAQMTIIAVMLPRSGTWLRHVATGIEPSEDLAQAG